MGLSTEFKAARTMGLPETNGPWGMLETSVPWWDPSGGSIIQEFKQGTVFKKRESVGTTNTWSAWV
jgi:hypothetical protein